MQTQFEEIFESSLNGAIEREEALLLFQETEDEAKAEQLFRTARRVRESII